MLAKPTERGATMKEYELMVLLSKKERIGLDKWVKSITVEAKSLVEAGKMAKTFGKQEAEMAEAKIADAFAIDLETGDTTD